MPATDSFTLFGSLPAELRLQIWTEALSVRSVWTVARYPSISTRHERNLKPLATSHVRWAPYLAGLACRESRCLMEDLYGKPLLQTPGLATGSGAYWVDLETTVVYLGSPRIMAYVLSGFDTDELSRFRHVAFRASSVADAATVASLLKAACPALRTMIIQDSHWGHFYPCFSRLSPGLAAYYTTIPDSFRPAPHDAHNFSHTFKALLALFDNSPSPPAIHVVSTEFADNFKTRVRSKMKIGIEWNNGSWIFE